MKQYRQVLAIEGRFEASINGLAAGPRDQLFAAGDASVKVFDDGGKPLREWTAAKPPLSVAVAGDGSVWAGEAGQVEIFDGEGRRADAWQDVERLGRVTAIGFVEDAVLVADASDRCLRRYSRHGEFLNNIGKNNRMKGFLIPNGSLDFSVDSEGIIHAANPGKHRVERYTAEGELLGHIGRFGGQDPAGFSGCCNPTNVAVIGRDFIYVTEKAGPRAKVYDFDGKLLGIIASKAFDARCKNMDITVDSRGRVWVADTARLSILAFEPEGGGTA